MKLDIRLLRRILKTIQEKESYKVSIADILEDVKQEYEVIDKDTFKDLFYGHLLLLKDNKVIEEVSNTVNLGLGYNCNGGLVPHNCLIRLTSIGYDYLKILNKSGFVDKLKDFTLKEGLKFAEYALFESAKNAINNIV